MGVVEAGLSQQQSQVVCLTFVGSLGWSGGGEEEKDFLHGRNCGQGGGASEDSASLIVLSKSLDIWGGHQSVRCLFLILVERRCYLGLIRLLAAIASRHATVRLWSD